MDRKGTSSREKSHHNRYLDRENTKHSRGNCLLMHELSHLRWELTGLAETHWRGTQERVVNGGKSLHSGGKCTNI